MRYLRTAFLVVGVCLIATGMQEPGWLNWWTAVGAILLGFYRGLEDS